MAENIEKSVSPRIFGHERGWAFSAKDFHLKWLPAEKRMDVLRDAAGVTDWVYVKIKRICQVDADG